MVYREEKGRKKERRKKKKKERESSRALSLSLSHTHAHTHTHARMLFVKATYDHVNVSVCARMLPRGDDSRCLGIACIARRTILAVKVSRYANLQW